MDMFKNATNVVLIMMIGTLCVALFTGNIEQAVFADALKIILPFFFGKMAGEMIAGARMQG